MNIEPVIYVPDGGRPAGQDDLDAVNWIMRDVALVLLRKTGRRLAVSGVAVVHGPAVDLSADLKETRTQWPIVQQTIPGPPGFSIVIAFVLGRPSDDSGLGAPGLALVGEGALVWAKKWRGVASSSDARMEYGGSSVLVALHELGHTLGLSHPLWPGTSTENLGSLDTVLSYALAAFALGITGTNPALFTDAELLTLQAHPALADVSWSAGPDVRLVPDADASAVLSGKIPAGWALVLGRFTRDYEVDAGAQP